jgi:predicted nucleic acid-binding protein
MECLVLPFRLGDEELTTDFMRFLEGYECAPLGPRVFDRAARLRAHARISTPDALHVACAIEQGCDEFWTNDHRLDRVTLPIVVRAFTD